MVAPIPGLWPAFHEIPRRFGPDWEMKIKAGAQQSPRHNLAARQNELSFGRRNQTPSSTMGGSAGRRTRVPHACRNDFASAGRACRKNDFSRLVATSMLKRPPQGQFGCLPPISPVSSSTERYPQSGLEHVDKSRQCWGSSTSRAGEPVEQPPGRVGRCSESAIP